MPKKDTHTYELKKDEKVVHRGITVDLKRREGEHQDQFSKSSIHEVGKPKTKAKALEWERGQKKTTTPKRK